MSDLCIQNQHHHSSIQTCPHCGKAIGSAPSSNINLVSLSHRFPMVLACLPSVLLWIAAVMMGLSNLSKLASGCIQPGVHSSVLGLVILFLTPIPAAIGGLTLAVFTCLGKVRLRWQLLSIVLGYLFWVGMMGD